MQTIENVETQDDYARPLTVEQEDGRNLLLIVANKSVLVQLRPTRRETGGDESYGPDLLFTPQTTTLTGVSGLKVKSAEAGQPARVIAVLTSDDEPLLAAGVPFLERLTAGGQIGPVGELAYKQFVAPVTCTSTRTTIVATDSFELASAADVWVEFFCPMVRLANNTQTFTLNLLVDGADVGDVWRSTQTVNVAGPGPYVRVKVALGAGDHTITVQGRSSGADNFIAEAGVGGGAGVFAPGYVRVESP